MNYKKYLLLYKVICYNWSPVNDWLSYRQLVPSITVTAITTLERGVFGTVGISDAVEAVGELHSDMSIKTGSRPGFYVAEQP